MIIKIWFTRFQIDNGVMFQDLSLLTIDYANDRGEIVSTRIGGSKVVMLIDSGAAVNAISENVFDQLKTNGAELFDIDNNPVKQLRSYASEKSLIIVARFFAKFSVLLGHNELSFSEESTEEFYVIKNATRNLLSRKTSLNHNILILGQEAHELKEKGGGMINQVERNESEDVAHKQFDSVEPEDFPAFKMNPVKLILKSNVAPTKVRYTNIPFNMRGEAQDLIEEMIRMRIIEEVTDHSKIEWVSSMLAVVKSNGKLRLVVDLRGPNKAIVRNTCRMPTLETILTELPECEYFSTIDLTNAFYHVKIHKRSRYITTFWTGDKYYRFARLPFGLTNAPDIFQQALSDIVLKGCKGVLNYLDDILVFGKTKQEHDQNLAAVLARLNKHNVKLNLDKCRFNQTKVKFLGFNLSRNGLSINEDKIKAVRDLREPETVAEVRSYLGLLTFLERFIIDRATKTKHLREITKSNVFVWTSGAQAEFDAIRDVELKRIENLAFYDPSLTTELIVDASPHGLGAVLIQIDKNNYQRIICCASKALTAVEKRYPQQHREALAMVWGTERFKFYLLGSKFTIKTDNRANEFIFGADAFRMGKRAISRAECWALRLQAYDFKVERVKGEENIADALSRLVKCPKDDEKYVDNDEGDTFEIKECNGLFSVSEKMFPITIEEIEAESATDEFYGRIKQSLETGIWNENDKGLRGLKGELRIWEDALYKQNRFYVPKNIRKKALEIGHLGHVGSSSMKKLMREYVWWPGMSGDIDKFHSNCRGCLLTSHKAPPPPLSPRELPKHPWQVAQIDFLKLTGICELLIVVDCYSRYVWAVEMKLMNADSTNEALMKICDIWGKPVLWQSDNGPPFFSKEFKSFWKKEGVKTRNSIPYAPQTNGLVERQNGPITHAVRVAVATNNSWRSALKTYLRAYNTRPHSSTGFSPFQLLQGRRYHDYLPVCEAWDGLYDRPSRVLVESNDKKAKSSQKLYADKRRRAKLSNIVEGDWVVVAKPKRLHKMDTTFFPDRYKVMRICGAKCTVRRETDGKDYCRWIGDLKRDILNRYLFKEREASVAAQQNATTELQNENIEEGEKVVLDSREHSPTNIDQPNLSPNEDHESNKSQTDILSNPVHSSRSLRDRKNIKMPNYLFDFELFHIYE